MSLSDRVIQIGDVEDKVGEPPVFSHSKEWQPQFHRWIEWSARQSMLEALRAIVTDTVSSG